MAGSGGDAARVDGPVSSSVRHVGGADSGGLSYADLKAAQSSPEPTP
jgi:hypothetical protein